MQHSKTSLDLSVTERLKLFVDYKGFKSYSDFYKKNEIAEGTLNKKQHMTTEKLVKVIDNNPDLNIYWLITGRGEMIIDKEEESKNSEINQEYHKALQKINRLTDELDAAKKEALEWKQEVTLTEVRLREALAENATLKEELAEYQKNSA